MNYKRQLKYSVLFAFIVWSVWLASLGFGQGILVIQENWQVSLSMILGSFIAGATSEGGGAIAFPIFTKILHVPPADAKLFALAIQSVGMSAAALTILLLKLKIEWRALQWGSIGGVFGICLGLSLLGNRLPPDIIKMTFTVITSSFAVALAFINFRSRKQHSALPIDGFTERSILLAAGFIGGVVTSLVGVGIDILIFIVLVLLFRVDEKVATPTSVILMAINSIFGISYQIYFLDGINQSVLAYWQAAVPVVVGGAPLGVLFCSLVSRKFIVWLLIFLISIELLTSLMLIPLRTEVVIFSIIALAICILVYVWMLSIRRYEMLI